MKKKPKKLNIIPSLRNALIYNPQKIGFFLALKVKKNRRSYEKTWDSQALSLRLWFK